MSSNPLTYPLQSQKLASLTAKKRVIGITLLLLMIGLFFALNRFPKIGIVGEDLDAVTSPAGTTAAGLFALEQGAFRATVMEAVLQATERSEALGRGEH